MNAFLAIYTFRYSIIEEKFFSHNYLSNINEFITAKYSRTKQVGTSIG